MIVAVAGSSGLVGSAIVASLREAGHTVRRLVRVEAKAPDEFSWDPTGFGVGPETLEGVDAVLGLGGVGIADRRWSGRFKQELRDSRITPTEVLAEATRAAGVPTFLSASATGFYGDTGERIATETDGPGTGFLAGLVTDWESAAIDHAGDDTRVVRLRTGPVLSPKGGLLAKIRPVFRLGLGGPIGVGTQYFSWISLVDEVLAIRFLLESEIEGPVNLVAPAATTFETFTKALGNAVHRPTVFRVPSFAARTVGGEMAEEMILLSQRVHPQVLVDAGFTFTHPNLDAALEYAT